MKKMLLVLAIISLFSFKGIYDLTNSSADVVEKNGLKIFSYSIPVKEYKIIGEVKNSRMTNGEHELVGDYLTEKAKKTYPTAQGIIIKFEGGVGKKGIYAEVIEFK